MARPAVSGYGRSHAAVIEAKVDLDRDFISLGDVNQADGHRRNIEGSLKLPSGQVASLIVTRVEKMDPAAKRSIGSVRALRLDVIDELQARLEANHAELLEGVDQGRREAAHGPALSSGTLTANAGLALPRCSVSQGTLRHHRGVLQGMAVEGRGECFCPDIHTETRTPSGTSGGQVNPHPCAYLHDTPPPGPGSRNGSSWRRAGAERAPQPGSITLSRLTRSPAAPLG
jgi:hypothetical protein